MDLEEDGGGSDGGGDRVYTPTSSTTRQEMRWARIRVNIWVSLTHSNASWTAPKRPQRTSTEELT